MKSMKKSDISVLGNEACEHAETLFGVNTDNLKTIAIIICDGDGICSYSVAGIPSIEFIGICYNLLDSANKEFTKQMAAQLKEKEKGKDNPNNG